MDLHQIEAFVEICSLQSFSKAARKLQINQSTISLRIQKLELQLGVPLFFRLGNSIQISKHGERFLPYAIQCLETLARGMEKVAEEKHNTNSKLRITAANPFQRYILPHLLPILMKTVPDFSVDIVPFTTGILREVRARQIDLCMFNGKELTVQLEGMNIVPLYEDDCVFLAHPSHSLVHSDLTLPDRLSVATFLLLSPRTGITLQILRYLKRHKVQPSRVSHVSSIAIAIEMAKKTDMVIVLPRLQAHHEIAKGSLTEILVDPKPEPLTTFLAYSHEQAQSDLGLIKFINQSVIDLISELGLPCRPIPMGRKSYDVYR